MCSSRSSRKNKNYIQRKQSDQSCLLVLWQRRNTTGLSFTVRVLFRRYTAAIIISFLCCWLCDPRWSFSAARERSNIHPANNIIMNRIYKPNGCGTEEVVVDSRLNNDDYSSLPQIINCTERSTENRAHKSSRNSLLFTVPHAAMTIPVSDSCTDGALKFKFYYYQTRPPTLAVIMRPQSTGTLIAVYFLAVLRSPHSISH